MIQSFYRMTYKEYKEHAKYLPSCVGHSTDEVLTDESVIVLKVSGEDHVHHHLEKHGFQEMGKLSPVVQEVSSHHPIMKPRGVF